MNDEDLRSKPETGSNPAGPQPAVRALESLYAMESEKFYNPVWGHPTAVDPMEKLEAVGKGS